MNKRRNLIVALGAGALAVPLGSFAQQQGKVWRIGFLWDSDQSDPNYVQRLEAFKSGLRELGYADSRDYAIEQRSARGDLARLSELAAELLSLKVDLIFPSGTASALAARKITSDVPIVFASVGDPVGSGLATNLRRPGGNVTGVTNLSTELYTKRLDLLRQILPGMRRVGFLYNPDNDSDALGLRQFESDCGKLQFTSIRAPVRKAEDVATAFNTLQRDKAQGLIVSVTIASMRKSIAELTAKHHLPAIFGQSEFAEAGGLIAYYVNLVDQYRRAATYADKIFKGAKAGDLPIEQPLKFETVINLKTAKALGIKIPDTIMLRADKVIE